MNYCSSCGQSVIRKIPEGDTLPRFVCQVCGAIHYENPKIVVGCIPEWEDQILLCRRAIEPRCGLWTFPAGFMENEETVEQAARRETLEEAKAEVDLTSLLGVFSLPMVSQVYLVFRATMRNPDYGVGHESSAVQLFKADDIPWETLAFPVIHKALTRYCQDRRDTQNRIHVETVDRLFHRTPHS